MLPNPPLSIAETFAERIQQGIRGWPPSIPFKLANIFSQSVKVWFPQTPNFSKENVEGSEVLLPPPPQILFPYPSCAPDLMESGWHIENLKVLT